MNCSASMLVTVVEVAQLSLCLGSALLQTCTSLSDFPSVEAQTNYVSDFHSALFLLGSMVIHFNVLLFKPSILHLVVDCSDLVMQIVPCQFI